MEKIVDFKIIAKENENITLTGCVDINTIDDDEPDFEYANSQEFYTPQRYWDIQAETSWKLDEEEQMIRENICNKVDADVCGDYSENAQCLWDFQDENKTIERGSYYLIINEGAKMECEIKEDIQYRGDFVVEVIPKFNGEFIQLAKYMSQNGVDFDPWFCQDDTTVIEKGHIYFEMSKDYWEGDAQDRVDRIKDVNEEARNIFAMYLTSELGIYSKYGEVMEQSIEMDSDDEFLFKLTQLINSSDEELDAFLRKEGYIDEELEN